MLAVFKKKIKKHNGESIAEVLIAVLIIALGLVLMSSLIMAANHMMTKSDQKLKTIYAGRNNVEMGSTDSSNVSGTITLTINSVNTTGKNTKVNIDVYKDTDSELAAFQIHK